tara:strand:+ start:1016 stop:2044 length:1029 start_codon:yes stop_codon:yes gene_type:complete
MNHKNLNVKIKIPRILKDNLKNKKISQIYKRFEKSLNVNENFAVAVSGGADSLALAFLAKVYSVKKGLNPKFYIVDHKLRPESTKEAKAVKKTLKQIFIYSKILTWKGKKPTKNIQSLARLKRYELIFKETIKYKIKNILLGHHQDDLLENFFIRMMRGSGLKGLVSLDKESKLNGRNLLRPLLDLKKEDLVFISKNVFNFYVNDPSNKDEKYKRIKIRNIISEFQKNGLDKEKFNKTISNLKYSNNVVNFYVNKNLENNSFFSSKNNKIILNKSFFQQPYEVTFRSLSELIRLIGKKHYPVRGKKIDKIMNEIENSRLFRATLGGCIVEKVNQTVIISKEL